MNKYLLGLLAALLIPACSEGDDPVLPTPPDRPGENKPDDPGEKPDTDSTDVAVIPPVRLFSNRSEANIFELVTFSIYSEGDSPDSSSMVQTPIHAEENLRTYYDSLVWSIPALDIRLKCFSRTSEEGVTGEELTSQWSNNFFLPGDYEMYLTGFRADSIVSRDTLRLPVANGRDFLGYKWSDITGKDDHAMGYLDLRGLPYEFRTYADSVPTYMMQWTPTLTLSLDWGNAVDHPDREAEREILFDYINALYGDKPVLPGQDNWEDAFALFGPRLESGGEVAAIWIEPHAKIALLREKPSDEMWEDAADARWAIYAEPL